MRYNQKAVKYFKDPSQRSLELARATHPFWLNKEAIEEARNGMDSKFPTRKYFEKLFALTKTIHERTEYDHDFSEEGIRNSQGVWEDRKGNCWEQNILLYTLIRKLIPQVGKNAALLSTTNPKGYLGGKLDKDGDHIMISYYSKRNELLIVDAVPGEVFRPNLGFCMGLSPLSELEFVAAYHMAAGEALGLKFGRFDEALSRLDMASQIDKNNYLIDITRGDVLHNKGDQGLAEIEYLKAMNKAPGSMDPHSEYVEFLTLLDSSQRKIVAEIKKALEKETDDPTVLTNLARNAEKIGEKDLEIRANEEIEVLKEKNFWISEWFDEEKSPASRIYDPTTEEEFK